MGTYIWFVTTSLEGGRNGAREGDLEELVRTRRRQHAELQKRLQAEVQEEDAEKKGSDDDDDIVRKHHNEAQNTQRSKDDDNADKESNEEAPTPQPDDSLLDDTEAPPKKTKKVKKHHEDDDTKRQNNDDSEEDDTNKQSNHDDEDDDTLRHKKHSSEDDEENASKQIEEDSEEATHRPVKSKHRESDENGRQHKTKHRKHDDDSEDDDENNTEKPHKKAKKHSSINDEAVEQLFSLYSDIDLSDLPDSENDYYDSGEYKEFWADPHHQKAKELLQRYTVFHNNKMAGSGPVNAVVVTPVGQLCNRLMTITSGFVLALLTKKVLLIEDSGFYCSMNDLFVKPGFEWLKGSRTFSADNIIMNPNHPPWPHTEKLLCGDLSVQYKGNIQLRMNQYMVPFLAWNPHYRAALQGIFNSAEAASYGEEYDPVDIFTPVSRFLFRPIPDLLAKKKQFMKRHFAGKRVVGMQVRSGNDFTQNFMKAKDWKLYETCGEDDGGSDSGDDVVYFVATDTQEGRDAAAKSLQYGEVVFGPGPFLRSNNPKGVQMALLDVLLLAETDTLITTAWSSFGYMAAGLRGRPKIIVSDKKEGGEVAVQGSVEQFFMGVPHKSDIRVFCARPPSHQPCFHKFANWGSREASCFRKEMIETEMLNGRYC